MVIGTIIGTPMPSPNAIDCERSCVVRTENFVRYSYYLEHCTLYEDYSSQINMQGAISGNEKIFQFSFVP